MSFFFILDTCGFQYVFNGKKTQNLTLIKEKFQTIFTNEAQNLFDALGPVKFEQLFGVDNVLVFKNSVVSNLNSPIYNFITIL